MASDNKPFSSARHVLLVFGVAGQRYGMRTRHIEQITALAELQCPPGMPKLLLGFLNLSGELVPVVGLRHLFGHPASPPGLWAPLIILGNVESRMGLLVDAVIRTQAVEADDVLPVPAGHSLNDWVEGIVRSPEGSVLVLSPERLLLHQEARAVAELQGLAQARLRELEGATA